MAQKITTVSGVVLREVDVGEYDKMLTVLTAELGKISVYANGAKRLKVRTLLQVRYMHILS